MMFSLVRLWLLAWEFLMTGSNLVMDEISVYTFGEARSFMSGFWD